MTNSSGQSDIEQVRDATDLVRLIGEHIALTPKGREHVGLCPFHDDHKPSFAVVTHKGHGFYHCFACGASGDCYRFVQEYHKMDFGEALRFLADRAGLTLQPRTPRAGGGPGDADHSDGPRRSDMLKALEFAACFFARSFADPVLGEAARTEATRRGMSETTLEQFQIGVAPEGYDNLLRRLNGRVSSIRTAIAAGLVRERDDDRRYDTFRNRLMFPIWDEMGRTIAFGGRVLDPDDQPKYLNSPENALFKKSRTLYGLHLARRSIVDIGEAIVTEGYTDVIACHQAGITNAVGTLGTALTAEHAKILSRLCPVVVLVFDGDEAGRKAADRAVEVFFRVPVDVRICVLPDGLDPDDLLRTPDGLERFHAAVEAATDALEFRLARFTATLDTVTGLSARQRRLEQFLSDLANLGFGSLQGVRKRLIYTRLADLLGLSIPDLERALPRRAPPRAPESRSPTSTATTPTATIEPLLDDDRPAVSRARQIAEREVLAIVLFEPAAGATDLPDTPAEPGIGSGIDSRSDQRNDRTGIAGRPLSAVLGLADFADPAARRIAGVILPWLEAGRGFAMPDVLAALPAGDPAGGVAGVAAGIFQDGRRRCDNDEVAALDHLADAVATLRACVRREQYSQDSSSRTGSGIGEAGEGPEAGPDNAGEAIDTVLDRIRRRHEHGVLPDAISQGVRA